jgi:hypothetical protein
MNDVGWETATQFDDHCILAACGFRKQQAKGNY